MDYVVGSVAALISGNVTPNRPRLSKKALTPVKHKPSPNVTPKSEVRLDRSIFLSPTMQKKKALLKKSPKRIFDDLDGSKSSDCNGNVSSHKAEKVKKQLQTDLQSAAGIHNKATDTSKEKRKNSINISKDCNETLGSENTSERKKGRKNKSLNKLHDDVTDMKKVELAKIKSDGENEQNPKLSPKKIKRNNKNKKTLKPENEDIADSEPKLNKKKKKKSKAPVINPNAITQADTDSEHESDNDINSDTDVLLETDKPEEDSSDDEDKVRTLKSKKNKEVKEDVQPSEEEIKRTLYVGNVPFTKKTKKRIKNIFGKHGKIQSVRIRGVPVKDAQTTPKMAVIKNELHPDRTTVNVYIKYYDVTSVSKALVENNQVMDKCHLRVSRSSETGAPHDTRKSVFVGNIPFALEDESLRSVFEKCGDIHSVRIVRDKKTCVGKGFGYINFTSKDGVELALSLTEEDLTVKNKILRVKRCTQFPPSNNRRTEMSKANRQPEDAQNQGAYRRLLHKRKNQEVHEVPPQKRPRQLDQPVKEKKPRKEFLGMTAEKKQKKKFNKGQKKKKAISEILTK